MDNLTIILIGVVVLFFVLLGVKQALGKKSERARREFCVVCLSISLTWIILLELYFSGLFNDKIIIALLMGMSITGVFYYLEARIKRNENLKIFRLPFILTLVFAVYSILESFSMNALYFVIGLWIIFGFFYSFKNIMGFNTLVTKLIECCKRW